MKTYYLALMLFVLLLNSCGTLAPAPTPTPIPLPPPQYAEGAFQWLETHAMLKDNVHWATLRNETRPIITNAKTTAETLPAICLAIQQLQDGNAWVLVPGLKTPNYYTGYSTLYPKNRVIINIDADSPAAKAGLEVGDRIEQINNHDPIPYPQMDAFPPCNKKPIDANLEEHLKITRHGQSLEVVIKKTQLVAGSDIYYAPTGQHMGSEVNGIGYLELPIEGGNHSQYVRDVQKLMQQLDKKPVCGWMIDLRRNQGGDIWSYMAAVGPLLGEGQLGGFQYLDGKQETWTYKDGQVFWNNEYRQESQIDGSIYTLKQVAPVAVLISPATQAAAELLLVAFHGRGDMQSFGEPTRGLPTLVTHTQLSDGTSLFVSGANSYDRYGTIYSHSIAPDMLVKTDWSEFGTTQDPVITTAMTWLKAQPACTK